MFSTVLFNIRNRMSAILPKNEALTVRNKNTNVGEIIKKLNKENKSFFGKLLETRQERRKREVKEPTNFHPLPNESDISSEALWCKRNVIPETNYKSAPKKIPNYEFDVENPKNMLNLKINTKQNLSNTSLNLEDIRITSFDNSIPTTHSDCEKTVKKPDVLELPNIIIRNIPTFPLQNNSKVIAWDRHMPLQSVSQDNCLSFPSVSKILSATMSESSRAALSRWQQRMISELGEEGFLSYQKDLLEKGSRFHSVIYNFLSGTLESELDLRGVEGCWHSMNDVIGNITDIRFLESHVVHPDLLYRGVFDCVASYKGKQVLIEWKRSTKQRDEIKKTYDAPVQLSAYIGAMNYDAKYDIKVQGGLIVVAYNDGCPACTFSMTLTDCQKYWKMWLHRLQKYWLMQHEENRECGIH